MWFLHVLLSLLPLLTESSPSNQRFAVPNLHHPKSHNQLKQAQPAADALFLLRGGSTKAPTSPSKYQMEQILLLQSRSTKLRQALTERGLLQDYATLDAPTTPQPVDWDCALATEEYPKPCLYSFDAEPNTKVVAPLGSTQWISLASLNRLRRTDPTKVEPMWHNQYAIFASWFRNGSKSPFSMYAHVPWQGLVLTLLLDNPLVLKAAVLAVLTLVLMITRPIWESMLTLLLTSQFLWKRWPNWARFVHAALPLKILLGQMSWKGLTIVFSKLQGIATEYLIQIECRIWEDAIPLTVLEGSMEETDSMEVDVDDDDVDSDY